ncbi:proprotein convertase P-domain-containing protein [Pseudoalteromonas aurantia]|uniref:proprotein convertase P-domain-containing protein n=1 Tax=Pseudoalteromonas aurantia TaxID=43654 RepID=UPI0032D57591
MLIPDGTLTDVDSHFEQPEELTVETVQIQLNTDHTNNRDVAVELISPSGTRSVVMTPRTGTIFGRSGFTETQMLSHNFYGESANGLWTLRLIDTQGQNENSPLVFQHQASLTYTLHIEITKKMAHLLLGKSVSSVINRR